MRRRRKKWNADIDYAAYMRSPQWQAVKRRFFASNMWKHNPPKNQGGWRCYCCEADDVPLDVHHRTYNRLGRENIAVDLVAVCRPCHDEIHKIRKTGLSMWTATKRVRGAVKARIKAERVRRIRLERKA